MKKYSILGMWCFVLVLFFQNCGKPPGVSESESAIGVVSSAQQYNKYSLVGFPTLSIWDYQKFRYLDLDLASGQMIAFEQNGQVRGETYQLPEAKLTEVRSLLEGAEVCEPLVNLEDREGRVCSMAYRYPYAILADKGEEIRLGEKTDGCDVPVDLCGDRATQLQSWSRSVIEAL